MRDYPSDVAAERAVLASVFRYGVDGFVDVADIVTSNTFSVETNQAIWKCIEHSMKDETLKSIDFPTIIASAKSLGLSDFFINDNDIKHLRSIMNTPIMPENGRRMAGRIRRFEVRNLLDRQLEEARMNIRGLRGDESINEIIAMAEQPIFDFTSLLTDAARSGPELMGKDAVQYVDYLMDNPRDMIGISTGLVNYDMSIGGGLRPNSLDIIVARMKTGKAQPLDATVHTANGPALMSEISIGAMVCTPNGLSKVVSIHPQGSLPVYKVTFSDGDSVECCLDHLWEVKNRQKKTFEVLPTHKLLSSLMDGPTPRWQVRLPQPCEYSPRPTFIPPYALGVLLGNGCLTGGHIGLTSADNEIISRCNELLDDPYGLFLVPSRTAMNEFTSREPERNGDKPNIYLDELRRLGVFGCDSHSKFIPSEYLHNSIEVRLEVLRGLLDTDGHANKRGGIEYSTTSRRLATDVKFLVTSIGGLCTVTPRQTKCNGKSFASFRLIIKTNDNQQLFHLTRKKERCRQRRKPPLKRTIRSILYSRDSQCQCIKLEDANGLYLTNNHVVTHNTQLVDNVGVHISRHEQIPVLNIDTEMTRQEHQVRIIAALADIPVKMIETGKVGFNQFDRKKVRDAAALLETLPYHYDCVIGRQFEDVLASLRRWVTRTVGLDSEGKANQCVIIYDYLKMLDAGFAGAGLQEWQALGYITTALKNFMGRYGVPCLCFAQSNRQGIDGEDTDVVGGSDRIAQYATSLTQYKLKTEEERADAGREGSKYTHKLVPLVSRHGEGLSPGDYINVQAQYGKGKLIEGPTRYQLEKGANAGNKTAEGFVVSDEQHTVQF